MHKKTIALIVATYLGTFMASLDISIVNVALPAMQLDMTMSNAGMQWVINSYAVCLAGFILASGGLSGKFGIKRMWLLGVAGFTASSILCAVAGDLSILIAGRAFQGVSAAFIIPGALSIIFHSFQNTNTKARVTGGWSACSAVALVLGPSLGGILVDSIGWHSIFVINIPIGIVALLLGRWGIQEVIEHKEAKLDLMGQILSIVWCGGFIYALIELGTHSGAFSLLTAAVALGSILAFIAFIYVEKNTRKPLVPFAMFRSAPFTLSNMASFILGFSYYSSLFFFSLFFQHAQGFSAAQAGLRMAPAFICTAIFSLVFGKIARSFSNQKLLITGYFLIGISLFMLGFVHTKTEYWIIGVLLSLMGMGSGLAVPATSISVLSYAEATHFSTASSIMNALRQAGMAFGIAILGAIMNLVASAHSKAQFTDVSTVSFKSAVHDLVVARNMTNAVETEILHASTASGFAWAMQISGVICITTAWVLLAYMLRKNQHALRHSSLLSSQQS